MRARARGRARVRARVRVTSSVLWPSLVSGVDLTGLASKQAASSKHARNGAKSHLCRGASDSAKILVDATYECEGQPHKV